MIVPVRTYVTVFVALVILTTLTALASLHNFGGWNTVIAVTIAVCKATLVALFFMHVLYSDRVVWLVALAGVFWLGILLALTLSDYWARSWLLILR